MKQSLLFLRCTRLILLLASVPFVVGANSVLAQDTYWNNGPGDWFEDSKWTDGIPSSGIDAYVDKNEFSFYPLVSLSGSSSSAEVNHLYLGHTAGSSFLKYVGYLDVTGGASLEAMSLTLGQWSYSYGNVHISGDDSSIHTVAALADTVAIGNYGEGEMLVENLGRLNLMSGSISLGNEYVTESSGNPASKGTLTITNGGMVATAGIAVGNYGQGFLTVSGGGTLESPAGANIGHGPRSTDCKATVTGSNSVWDCGSITVGYQGSGATLEVKQGGRFNGNNLTIGHHDYQGGSATISDSSSRINLSGYIYVRKGGLTINDGLVQADSLDMRSTGWTKLYGGTLDVVGLDAINGDMYLYGGTLKTSRYWAGAGTMENDGATIDPTDYLLEVLYDSSHPGEYRWYDQDSGSLWIDVDGDPASGLFDKVVASQITFDGGSLKLDFTYVPTAGTTYQFLDTDGPYIGGSCPVYTYGLPGDYWVDVDFAAGTFTVMPEPSTFLLLFSGVAALLVFALRRRR